MSTWNTIARSKRAEWRRKDGRVGWTLEQRAAKLHRWVEAAHELMFTSWSVNSLFLPGTDLPPGQPGDLLRIALGPNWQPEGPPYIHTYTVGHPWEWQPEPTKSGEPAPDFEAEKAWLAVYKVRPVMPPRTGGE